MIELSGVSKSYGSTKVVDNVTLTIPRGGITSLIGPNGAGKSTLLSMMSRLVPMDSGRITVDGLDIATAPSSEIARRLAILRQDNHVSMRLTVYDLVSFGRFPHSRGRLTAVDREHIERAIAYLDLDGLAHRYLDELSGGQRQRAFVAMVLCQDTDYLLLDEPLNSLDMKHALEMMRLLRRTVDELGKTVVLVLHDINFASCHSDRIIAMRDGVVVRQGTPAELMESEALRAVYDMDIDIHELNGRRIGVYFG
ncbi:MAG TPA: ABC transporter ATP-binding protein [Micromonospora sp.]